MNKILIIIVLIIVVGGVGYYYVIPYFSDTSGLCAEGTIEKGSDCPDLFINDELHERENKEGLEGDQDESAGTPQEQSELIENLNAGLVIDEPLPNQVVVFPVAVRGVIHGDGWYANEGEVGHVEIYDANDKSISNATILKATSDWLTLPTTFESMVGDRQMMNYIETDTGYLKFTNQRVREGDVEKEFIVPVQFR